MKTRSDYIAVVKKYVGMKQGSAEHKAIVSRFNQAAGTKFDTTAPWCAIFASACAVEAQVDTYYPISASCSAIITAAKKAGTWVESDAYIPTVGDWIVYDWTDSGKGDDTGAPDHVGIVTACDGKTITVIEGNYSKQVKERQISVNGRYIRGFVHNDAFKEKTTVKTQIKASGVVYPSALTSGSGFAMSGTITANKTMTRLEVGVVSGKAWTAQKYDKTVKAKKIDLATIKGVNFAKLAPGTYYYRCYAWCGKEVVAVFNEKFTVKDRNKEIRNNVAKWAKKYAANDKYDYKKWTSDKKTHQCPLCHPKSGNGWNCIGFASAALYHGGGLKFITCSCSGIGNNATLTSNVWANWKKRNGGSWRMIGTPKGAALKVSQLQAGDILLCYTGGVLKHVAVYVGNSQIAHARSVKYGILTEPYSNLTSKARVAMRYTGDGTK